jgi:hypothetical protein
MKYILMAFGGLALAVAGFMVGRAHPAHPARQSQEEIFKNRFTCDNLAGTYVKAESDDITSVSVVRVDFSPAHNSCIASTFGSRNFRDKFTLMDYKVVDLMSHEELFSESCDETRPGAHDFCGNGRNSDLMRQRDKAFDDAMQVHP